MTNRIFGKEDLVKILRTTAVHPAAAIAIATADDLLAAIATALIEGRAVRLAGVGTLTPVVRPERSGVDPTGKRYRVGARHDVRFRPVKALCARKVEG